MNTRSKELLVAKTEIFFNKKDLMKLLASATKSNIVAISTKHFSINNEICISHQAQPKFLDVCTGQTTPEKSGAVLIGTSPVPCPYPPGCNPDQETSKANVVGGFLKLQELQDK